MDYYRSHVNAFSECWLVVYRRTSSHHMHAWLKSRRQGLWRQEMLALSFSGFLMRRYRWPCHMSRRAPRVGFWAPPCWPCRWGSWYKGCYLVGLRMKTWQIWIKDDSWMAAETRLGNFPTILIYGRTSWGSLFCSVLFRPEPWSRSYTAGNLWPNRRDLFFLPLSRLLGFWNQVAIKLSHIY